MTLSHFRRSESGDRRVIVVGAGVAGSVCARDLASSGWSVTLLDKGRGPGGRASSRRSEPYRFDHGAQYFTVRGVSFRRRVESMAARGIAKVWRPRIASIDRAGTTRSDASDDPPSSHQRWVACPGMNDLVRDLQYGLDVSYGQRVERVERTGEGWVVRCADRAEKRVASHLILAVPAPQAAALLPDHLDVRTRLDAVSMQPCWAVMIAFRQPLSLSFDAAHVEDGPLRWIARQPSRPDRPPLEAWVLHASPEWSRQYLEADPPEVAEELRRVFQRIVQMAGPGHAAADPVLCAAHRWRCALVDRPLGAPFLWRDETRLGLCGDWCLGPRIEAAFESGRALARCLLRRHAAPTHAR